MPLDRRGNFNWVDYDLTQGMRQNISEARRHSTLVRNLNFRTRGGPAKDEGLRKLSTTVIDSGTYDTYRGFDAHFNDGTQHIVVVNGAAADYRPYVFNSGTSVFDIQTPVLAQKVPSMFMYNNKLIITDGTALQAMDSALAWTTPAPANANACEFGTSYNNRVVLAGNASLPDQIFVSDVKDITSFQARNTLQVTGIHGDALKNLGVVGDWLVVNTSFQTWIYRLGDASPRSWNRRSISRQIGITHHASYLEVPTGFATRGHHMAFWWSWDGPVMLIGAGDTLPVLVPLKDALFRMIDGDAYQGAPALDTTVFDQVQTAYDPHLREVRFACRSDGAAKNDMLLGLDLESAMLFGLGELDAPFFRIRDNTLWGSFPCTAVFTAQVDAAGAPSSTGQRRFFGAQDGFIWEMGVNGVRDDNGFNIPIQMRRIGYTGDEEGIAVDTKTVNEAHLRTAQPGPYTLHFRLLSDYNSRTEDISLAEGLSRWGSFVWGTDPWNSGASLRTADVELAGQGEIFGYEIFDNGNILDDFQIDRVILKGFLEGR